MPRLDMRTLQAYQPTPVSVQAEFNLRGREIHLQYRLQDPNHEVLDTLSPGNWTQFPRADELWKTTCLEAFWGIPGEPSYWELNLSPSRRAWNLYRFTSYREPQPPERNADFELASVTATADSLSARLTCGIPVTKLEASLTAVIRTAHSTHYFALQHASPKADFHRRETFILGI